MVSWRRGARGLIPSLSSPRWDKARLFFSHTSSSFRKTPSEELIPLTLLEIEQMQGLLQKGFQVWEVALHIRRSESVVRRSLQENDGLSSLLRKVKRGRWSSAEEHLLLRYLAKRSELDKKEIAQLMGRTADNVARQIRKIAKVRDPPMPLLSTVTSPDEELSQFERATLEARLECILMGLTKANKTEQWDRILMGTPRAEWVERILALIPTPVGRLLAAPSPPTISTLRSLEWENSSNMGVYTWILTRKIHNPFYPKHYVYVGSATKYGWGLSGRKYQHQKGGEGSSFTLRHRIQHNGLAKKGHFVTLLSMEVTSPEPNEVVKARQMIVLAEAAFTIWLGALTQGRPNDQKERLLLRSLCPWSLEQMSYRGVCSHNPLSMDISYPQGYAQL
ncbi:hypothetical protein NUW58_g8396 [Xylaria curta]|uniref:Uncharacterized protein n=1 Tax=Xylaria curta TaxID=42375 RepID=A0ACC1N8Q3_9PEZI|nr:hypothetical protein NUW58_g8396 [Xylaria curta]